MGTTGVIIFILAGGLVEHRCLVVVPVVIVGAEVVGESALQQTALHASLVAVDNLGVEGFEIIWVVVEVEHSRTTATGNTGVDVVPANHVVEGCTAHPRPVAVLGCYLLAVGGGLVEHSLAEQYGNGGRRVACLLLLVGATDTEGKVQVLGNLEGSVGEDLHGLVGAVVFALLGVVGGELHV